MPTGAKSIAKVTLLLQTG